MTDALHGSFVLLAVFGIAVNQALLDLATGATAFLAGIGVAALALHREVRLVRRRDS